ncbi:hypothetical protein N7454_010793 [Penicillium verhagenii]|nr:hypothetical protein N7454_010793 [Penicillium verhagenii]
MGQSSSTARNSSDIGYPDYLNPASIVRDPGTRDEDMNHSRLNEQNGEAGTSSSAETYLNNQHESFSNQTNGPPEIRQQPIRYSGGGSHSMRSIGEEDASELEGNEQEYRSAATTRMAARRQSTMSRLGSRILPNSVIRGLLSSQEETPAEGHAHRHGIIGHGGFGTRAPILDNTTERLAEPSRSSWRRSARLHRVRHSLSTPISHMFGQPSPNVSTLHDESPRLSFGQSMSDRLPSAMDTRLDFGEPLHELDSVEPSIHANATVPSGNPQLVRRLPGLLRARSTRSLRGEEPTPLSRVLQLAAAAIAAQLSGANGPPLPNIQALGNDGLGGSLENFIQSLQSATSVQAQPTASTEGPSNSGNDGPPPPVNFLRVFRFANADSPAGVNPSGRNNNGFENLAHPSDEMSVDEPADTTEGRTVTLVVVGVRSVQAGSSNGAGSEQGPATPGGPGLEALLGLPFLPPSNTPRPHEASGDFGHRTDRRARLHVPRSAGSSGFQVPSLPDLLRHPGTNTSRRLSDVGSRIGLPNFPLSALSESPPGPHPPPSTPAEQGLSAVSSNTSTPSRRPSSASAMSPSILPQLHENRSMQPATDETVPPPSAARHRRRSDSEYARHRALGSGSVRRNGVVEPDQPPPSGGRSWLIYVVGTNLSENHPALTTPSLFTDNPTYEDMILLSSLLGPAKPPVATQADINSAGGLFRLVEYEGSLVAESVNGARAIHIQDGERCLICLSDYEVAEEWLTTGRNSCPLCRGEGVDETPSNDDHAPPDAIPASAPEVTAI